MVLRRFRRLAGAAAACLAAASAAALSAQETFTRVCGPLAGETRWDLAGSPYRVECDSAVPKGSTLTIEAGVEVQFAGGARLTVNGQIYALGEAERRIVLTRVPGGGSWDGIAIDHGNDGDARESILRFAVLSLGGLLLAVHDTGDSPVLVEDCRFDRWTVNAVDWDSSHGLRIRRSEFGLDTPEDERDHETIHGSAAGAVVEHCTFGPRRAYNDVMDISNSSWGGPVPSILYNLFLGGDDDAIDFDDADGWIIGNVIIDHWPRTGGSSSANGGGITGEDSSPVVANNVVYRSFHGIGFKNASNPLIASNLVLDGNVGITLYKDGCSQPRPRGTLVNNIVWNNHHPQSGALRNIVLHGGWWVEYCGDTTELAAAEVRSSIVEGGWPGEGNSGADPRIADPVNGDYGPALDSPALDAAFGGPFSHPGVDAALLQAVLAVDRGLAARADLACIPDRGSGAAAYWDIGPIETQAPGPCSGEPAFIRGDSNLDGAVDVSDAVHSLLVLFAGLEPENCDDARDANDDGARNLSDPVYLLEFLFRFGPRPPPPYPSAGLDPSEDGLGCPDP
jgi:hypothetical protein